MWRRLNWAEIGGQSISWGLGLQGVVGKIKSRKAGVGEKISLRSPHSNPQASMAWMTRFLSAVAFFAFGVLFAPNTFHAGDSSSSLLLSLKLLHLLSFSTAWGTALWVTFIGGIIMFKLLLPSVTLVLFVFFLTGFITDSILFINPYKHKSIHVCVGIYRGTSLGICRARCSLLTSPQSVSAAPCPSVLLRIFIPGRRPLPPRGFKLASCSLLWPSASPISLSLLP